LTARADSAFVIIGTERELIARGVARKEGGNRLLFGIGKTLVPAREIDGSTFRVVSKSRDATIQFPRADRSYRLVSRHNLQFTDAAAVRNATVRGSLKITNPEAFWAPSKYLIFVER
jgi:hypothetical protein